MRPNAVELQAIYSQRFDQHIAYRNEVWKVLVSEFFANYIAPEAAVLDLGCGYGQFINNVECQQRYAMDLNKRAKEYLSDKVVFLEQDCSAPWALPDESLDVVFTSNFFEHLLSKQALNETLAQALRCLRPGGRLMAMGPNIKYVGGAYWDFCDHHLALTEASVMEAMRVQGFAIERVIARFLPYTMANRRPVPTALVSLYLKLPLAWRLFGAQFFVVGRKSG
jgi:SAM-dependent methyltransferase